MKETDGKDGASDRPASDMEFGIQVLQAGAWPDYKALDVKLPPEVNWFQEVLHPLLRRLAPPTALIAFVFDLLPRNFARVTRTSIVVGG